jgi:hypothetical protein
MAFGFNPAQFQQATAIDPAAAGLPVPQNLPPVMPQQAQPAPVQQAAPQSAPMDNLPPPPQWGHRGWLGDMLDNLFLGGAIQHTRGDEYARSVQDYNAQMSRQVLDGLPPAARMAAILNPGETGKAIGQNFAPQTIAEGATLQRGPGLGLPGGYGTKVSIDDKSGVPMALTPGGATQLGPSVGGDYSVKDGVILSGRTGPRGSYSQFQQVAPGSTPGQFQPSISMGPSGAPQLNLPPPRPGPVQIAPQAGASASPGAPQAGGPLPIRQNNFGALRALPNGQQWQGQVGIGPGGHVIFDTPENGMRANLMNLRNKQAVHGLQTLGDIIAAPGAGWDPGNGAYAQTVSRLTGIPVNQPVDLSDPATLGKVADGIFSVENGPQAWRAYKAQVGASPGQAPGAQSAPGGFQATGPAKTPRILPPDDPRYQRFAPGTVLQESPAGEVSVVQKPEYSPEAKTAIRDHVLGSDEYKQASAAQAAYKAMIGNASTMSGPSAYAILDTFARAINPGAVARQSVIDTIEKHLGPLNQVAGGWSSVLGQGNLTPQVRQQIIDAVVPFVQSHWDQATRLNQANAALAKTHGFDAADVTAPLEDRPRRYVLKETADAMGIPTLAAPADAARLHPGSRFRTPDGRLKVR